MKMPRRRILFINQTSGYLMRDILHVFAEYHDVVLMASSPVEGVKYDKVSAYDRRSSVRRIISWLIATVQIWCKVWGKYSDWELFIVSNPPFATLLPFFLKNRYSLFIFDIYPDVLVNQHFLSADNFIVKWWQKTNRKVYARADQLFTISEGMRDCLCQYVAVERIQVVPLWTDKSNIHRIAIEDNYFMKEHHLENKFVVLYSGNLGNTHPVDVLIDVAKRVNDPDVIFVIIGEGGKKKLIEDRIEKEKCKNVKMLPRQPYDMLSYSLSVADIAVITLDMNSSQLSVPSKTYNLLAIGVPLLCIASPDSELGNLVRKYEVGGIFYPDEIDRIVDFILCIKNDIHLKRRYVHQAVKASSYYTVSNARILLNVFPCPYQNIKPID